MRHRKTRNRLTQKPAHARMLKRNLVTSLLLYERIRTTKKRAKVIQPTIDKLISYAKTHPPQQAVRYLNRTVTDKNASRKVMEVFIDRYKNRSSGLTRIKPAGVRGGDGAEVVDLELVDYEMPQKKEPSLVKTMADRAGSEKRKAEAKTDPQEEVTAAKK